MKYLLNTYLKWWAAVEHRIETEQYTVATIYVMFGIAVAGTAIYVLALAIAQLPEWLIITLLFPFSFYAIRGVLKYDARQKREWDDLLNNRTRKDDE